MYNKALGPYCYKIHLIQLWNKKKKKIVIAIWQWKIEFSWLNTSLCHGYYHYWNKEIDLFKNNSDFSEIAVIEVHKLNRHAKNTRDYNGQVARRK